MNADFHDAHDRHWQDAENLHSSGRLANADHLFGLAAECGMKRLMLAFGMPLGSDGSPGSREDRKHADQLWARYDAYRAGHYIGVAYALPASNPFSDWRVDQRYANQTEFGTTQVYDHRQGASLVRLLVSRAQVDGLIG